MVSDINGVTDQEGKNPKARAKTTEKYGVQN